MEKQNTKEETINELNEATPDAPEERADAQTVSVQDFNKVIDELKDLRKKNAELKESKAPEVEATPAPTNMVEAVKQVLVEERKLAEQERTSNAKTSAFDKFKKENPLFNPSNDPDGNKFSVIEKELENFNLSGARTEEDFKDFLIKAAVTTGVVENKEQLKSVSTPTYSPTPNSQHATAVDVDVASLTKEERTEAQQKGISEERMAELKKKYPENFGG